MKKIMLAVCLVSICLLLGCSVALADTNAVAVLPTAELVPTQSIPPAFTVLLGKWAPLYVSVTSFLFSLGVALKPFMASFQHGMNDRLAFSIDILGTDADVKNRRLLSSAFYRTLAYWADLLLRLKLPTIDGYLAQLKAQSTPGPEPKPTPTIP